MKEFEILQVLPHHVHPLLQKVPGSYSPHANRTESTAPLFIEQQK